MGDNLLEGTTSYGVFTMLSKFTTLKMFYSDFWVRRILYSGIFSYGEFFLGLFFGMDNFFFSLWLYYLHLLSNVY